MGSCSCGWCDETSVLLSDSFGEAAGREGGSAGRWMWWGCDWPRGGVIGNGVENEVGHGRSQAPNQGILTPFWRQRGAFGGI